MTEGVNAQEAAQVVGFPVQTAMDADGAQGAVFAAGPNSQGLLGSVGVESSCGCLYGGAGDRFQRGELLIDMRVHELLSAVLAC